VVIAVAIWGDDAATNDGIAALVDDAPGVEIIGTADDEPALIGLLEAAHVDIVVLALDPDPSCHLIEKLTDEVGVVAVLRERSDAMAALRAGARGVLLHPVRRAEIAAALQSVAAGLSVLPAGWLDDVLRPSRRDGAETLTSREMEVLALIAAGASNKLIARRLGISVHTAKFHVAGVLEKLGAHSRAEAVAIGARLGLVLL
jgi:DNA-binding NarL/FixJ family response regulator